MKTFLVSALFLSLLSLGQFYPLENVDSSDSDSSEHGVVPTERSNNCTCGWANKDDQRIVGGKKTKVNENPMIAGFVHLERDLIICGGTIVTKRHIVTAAHCTDMFGPSEYGIFVGHNNYEQEKVKGNVKLLEPQEFIIHEQYDGFTMKYDIAIVLMKDPIEFNNNVGPACLPTVRMSLETRRLKVLGWGLTKYSGNTSDVLLKVNLDVQKLDMCLPKYERHLELDDIHQICTYRKNKDSCEGDSGGPLLWLDPDTNRYTLVAVTSLGYDCAVHPAVSSDVTYFLPWIQKVIYETDPSQQTCAKL